MTFFLGILEGLREIAAHKFRSLLTISGIVLGVASLMSMFAVVEGMTEGMRRALNRSGGVERIQIDSAEVPPSQEAIKDLSPGRTYADVTALRQVVPQLLAVSPEKRLNRVVALTAGNRRTFIQGMRGVERFMLQVESAYQIGEGRFITDLDVERKHRVVVLGSASAAELFEGTQSSPIGATVRIDGISFTVVGVMQALEMVWMNNRVFIPITTMQETFFSSNVVNGVDLGPDRKLDNINIRVRDVREFNAALEGMRRVLGMTHRGIQDFGFRTREDWFEAIEGQVQGARLSGAMVAVVCLLAGGVGITNIMLASIKERTREIGVRRAIGARPWDVFSQITLEVLLLAFLGGVVGLVVGYGLVEWIAHISPPERQPILVNIHVLISFISGVVVGLAAGFIPAWKASQLEPIEALRYE